MKIAAIVPAAGSGERLNFSHPKALVGICGHSLIYHAMKSVMSCVDFAIITAPHGYERPFERAVDEWGDQVRVVTGGTERRDSVAIAMSKLPQEYTHVLVHDAARAFTPTSVFLEVIHELKLGREAVIPALPVVDTVKRVDNDGVVIETLDRSHLRRVQTPQGFLLSTLLRAHQINKNQTATDDASLVEAIGVPVLTVLGHDEAHKITVASDLEWAQSLVNGRLAKGQKS